MFPTVDTDDNLQVTSLNSKTTSSRNVPESLEQQVIKQNNKEPINMLVKEVVFCLALALTTYGALHNSPSKVSKYPQEARFFNSESLVSDWHKGHLSKALKAVNQADVSFVMYYAPWDAESQYVRGEFEKAASVLSDWVHFSAINCWSPGSECRLLHNKISSWPILIAYTITSKGVLYKGPKDAHSMVKFLELIIKPLQRISSTEDLVNLLSICDAVAIGYTPLTDTSKYYNIWYNVALKARESDTIGEICFGVVTSEELSMNLGVESFPSARLMLWNNTQEYLVDKIDTHMWSESALTEWVLENFTQPVARIIPMWRKSFSFERYVDGNPILMLFTPLNVLYPQLPAYEMLREIAMEYYNCKNNTNYQWTSELLKLQQMQRLLYQQKDIMKFCQKYKYKKPLRKTYQYKKEIVAHNNKYPWNNVTQTKSKAGVFNFLVSRSLDISKVIDSPDSNVEALSPLGVSECSTKMLPAKKSFYDNFDYCQSFEDNSSEEDIELHHDDTETTMLPFEDDPLSPENLVQTNVKHFCELMRFAYEWAGRPVFPGKVNSGNTTHIHGLACANNFSLNMIAVDSVANYHFAESLGIDIKNRKDMTAVVILDTKQESQYVLKEEYNGKSVRDFIRDYSEKRLKRTLRTPVPGASHTHYFGNSGDTSEQDDSTINIIDLTTHTFRKVIRTPGVMTLVAVCGGACSSGVTRAMCGAARALGTCGVRAQPARLDATAHDLPWQYTPHQLPALLVFPPGRGEESSRVYPTAARVSASGVVALALRSLGAPHHLRVRLALCHAHYSKHQRKICLKDLKEHITTVIDRNLKYWRRTELAELKDALLRRLQNLHRVSLNLSLLHVDDLNKNKAKHQCLLVSLSTLSDNWDIDVSVLRSKSTSQKTKS